jgi:hypothetical protein
MIFRCQGKFHELCFESNCKRTIGRRNLVSYTVVQMPIYEEEYKDPPEEGEHSVTNERNGGMKFVQLMNQTSSHVTTVLIEKIGIYYCPFPDVKSYLTYLVRVRISNFSEIIL